MAKKTWNPSDLASLVADGKKLIDDVIKDAPDAIAVVSDFLRFFGLKGKQATGPVTCGPTDGCGKCLACVKQKAMETLYAAVCAECCDDCPAAK